MKELIIELVKNLKDIFKTILKEFKFWLKKEQL